MVAALAVAAYFLPIYVMALVAAVTVILVAWWRPIWVFTALLALLPVHDQLLRIATWQLGWTASRVTLLSLWKEAILVLLFGVLVVQHLTGRRRIRFRAYHFDLWLLALVVLAAAYIIVANTAAIGIFGFRNYLEPLALLFLARLLPYDRRDLQKLLVVLLMVAAAVAAYGIYQAQFIDFPTMISMGYVDEYGNLPFAFKTALQDFEPRPRAISTVTGPNQLAIYLNLFILLCTSALVYLRRGSQKDRTQRAIRTGQGLMSPPAALGLPLLLGLFGVCLLLTFSRGGLLALAVSLLTWAAMLIYDHGIKQSWRELTHRPWLMAALAAIGMLAVAGLILSGFARRVLRGLTGQDPAALGHLSSMDQALNFISDHPLGIGLGMAGPRALRFISEAQVQHTESTYLQFGMETGLVGMALLLVLLLSLMATLWRLRQKNRRTGDRWAQALTEVAFIAWAGALAVFTVTPLMQNFLVASYLWLLAGFAFHLDAYPSARPAQVTTAAGAQARAATPNESLQTIPRTPRQRPAARGSVD